MNFKPLLPLHQDQCDDHDHTTASPRSRARPRVHDLEHDRESTISSTTASPRSRARPRAHDLEDDLESVEEEDGILAALKRWISQNPKKSIFAMLATIVVGVQAVGHCDLFHHDQSMVNDPDGNFDLVRGDGAAPYRTLLGPGPRDYDLSAMDFEDEEDADRRRLVDPTKNLSRAEKKGHRKQTTTLAVQKFEDRIRTLENKSVGAAREKVNQEEINRLRKWIADEEELEKWAVQGTQARAESVDNWKQRLQKRIGQYEGQVETLKTMGRGPKDSEVEHLGNMIQSLRDDISRGGTQVS